MTVTITGKMGKSLQRTPTKPSTWKIKKKKLLENEGKEPHVKETIYEMKKSYSLQ